MSQWVHSRIWPLLVMKFVDNSEDPVLCLGLLLHEIVERLTAAAFYTYEIGILEEKVVEYLNLRKTIRDEFPAIMVNPKPKHHFLREGFNNTGRGHPKITVFFKRNFKDNMNGVIHPENGRHLLEGSGQIF